MFVFVGLGNPGKQYQKTRHNIGFLILDKLQKRLKTEIFKESKRFNAQISKNKNFILVKPLTFMNKSGESVSKVASYFKVSLNEIVVIHDDVDILLGKIKIGFAEGEAGHNGVKSISGLLGSKNFWRIRVGVLSELKEKTDTDKFVLANFTKEEQLIVDKIIDNIAEEIFHILKNKNITQKGINA